MSDCRLEWYWRHFFRLCSLISDTDTDFAAGCLRSTQLNRRRARPSVRLRGEATPLLVCHMEPYSGKGLYSEWRETNDLWFSSFKYLFCVQAAAMLVLATCVELDDVVHWALKHKTRLVFYFIYNKLRLYWLRIELSFRFTNFICLVCGTIQARLKNHLSPSAHHHAYFFYQNKVLWVPPEELRLCSLWALCVGDSNICSILTYFSAFIQTAYISRCITGLFLSDTNKM